MKRMFSAAGKHGQPPGTMDYTGKSKDEPLQITLIDFSADQVTELTDANIDDCLSCKETDSVSWINIEGLTDTSVIGKIGQTFDIHPLVLEDILHTSQRPKLEDHTDYLYLVVRMLYIPSGSDEILL